MSNLHIAMEFMAEEHFAIITVKAEPKEARTCHMLSLKWPSMGLW